MISNVVLSRVYHSESTEFLAQLCSESHTVDAGDRDFSVTFVFPAQICAQVLWSRDRCICSFMSDFRGLGGTDSCTYPGRHYSTLRCATEYHYIFWDADAYNRVLE